MGRRGRQVEGGKGEWERDGKAKRREAETRGGKKKVPRKRD
jgi:hypothetical protein